MTFVNHLKSKSAKKKPFGIYHMIEPTQEEKMAMVKYARHTALAADRICGSLLGMAKRLEEAKIIDSARKSKSERNKKLKGNYQEISVSDEEITKLMKKIQDNPDAESIVASLFRDLSPAQVKSAVSSSKPKEKKEKEAE